MKPQAASVELDTVPDTDLIIPEISPVELANNLMRLLWNLMLHQKILRLQL